MQYAASWSLVHVRRELDRLAALRLLAPLSPTNQARWALLVLREEELLPLVAA